MSLPRFLYGSEIWTLTKDPIFLNEVPERDIKCYDTSCKQNVNIRIPLKTKHLKDIVTRGKQKWTQYRFPLIALNNGTRGRSVGKTNRR